MHLVRMRDVVEASQEREVPNEVAVAMIWRQLLGAAIVAAGVIFWIYIAIRAERDSSNGRDNGPID